MPGSADDLEAILRRCQDRLSEIDLNLPDLETAPKPVRYALDPPAPPRREPPPETPAPEERDERPVLPSVESPAAEPPSLPAPTPIAAVPADSKRTAISLAIVAAAGTMFWFSRRGTRDVILDIDRADGLAVRLDGNLVLAQGLDLVTLSPDGRALQHAALDGPVDDLSWDQGSLWSVDGRTPTVVERRDGGRPTVFQLNHVPGTVFARDKYLWTAEKNGHALHQFVISRSILGALLQPLDLYELPGLTPETFALDEEGTLWVIDAHSRRIYRLRAENGAYRQIASAALSPVVGGDADVRSLRIRDGAVWILVRPSGGHRSILRRLVLSRLDWSPS